MVGVPPDAQGGPRFGVPGTKTPRLGAVLLRGGASVVRSWVGVVLAGVNRGGSPLLPRIVRTLWRREDPIPVATPRVLRAVPSRLISGLGVLAVGDMRRMVDRAVRYHAIPSRNLFCRSSCGNSRILFSNRWGSHHLKVRRRLGLRQVWQLFATRSERIEAGESNGRPVLFVGKRPARTEGPGDD